MRRRIRIRDSRQRHAGADNIEIAGEHNRIDRDSFQGGLESLADFLGLIQPASFLPGAQRATLQIERDPQYGSLA
jgi:hypothetical protein